MKEQKNNTYCINMVHVSVHDLRPILPRNTLMSMVLCLYRTALKDILSCLLFLYRDLQNNSISNIPPLAFRNLWRLLTLNLQHNYIRTLSNSSFYGLTNLSNLYVLLTNKYNGFIMLGKFLSAVKSEVTT